MDNVFHILKKIRSDIDFDKEKALIDDSILDSLDVFQIIDELSDAFDIDINPAKLSPKDFNSAESIYAMVQRLLEQV